ncbi:WD40-repeat-containing domain protein [Flagelloscypha sp. PMI_526]|nr:WD40-repeat-containing domain protein [Flagelloscypha sp. PMI_526]
MAEAAQSTTSNYLVSEAHLILEEARRVKSERTKNEGDPIQLPGKALDIKIQANNVAWIADNTHVARKLDLETGKTLDIYRGHFGPVTTIALFTTPEGKEVLITGAWDKTIKLWDTKSRSEISTTNAHSDFVKTLIVIPGSSILVSGSSDKIVRLWDLSNIRHGQALTSLGSISAHTRPVEALDGISTSSATAILCTGDTMGVIKLWELQEEVAISPPRWRSTLKGEYTNHRTKISQLIYGEKELWTASADETAQVIIEPLDPTTPANPKRFHTLTHRLSVRCILPLSLTDICEPYVLTGSGDVIYIYDMSSPDSPELLNKVDSHWHDVTALKLWQRTARVGDIVTVEPWIVSTSLDGTIRRWRLVDLLKPSPPIPDSLPLEAVKKPVEEASNLTEEEERELAELMGDD